VPSGGGEAENVAHDEADDTGDEVAVPLQVRPGVVAGDGQVLLDAGGEVVEVAPGDVTFGDRQAGGLEGGAK
jgi:hypothetical protein